MIISLSVFCRSGFKCAAAVCVAALCCSALFFFLRKKNDICNTVFICLLTLLLSSGLYMVKLTTEYLPAKMYADSTPKTVTGRIYEHSEKYGKHYYTVDAAVINGIETDCKIRIALNSEISTTADDILTVKNAVIYTLGESNDNELSYMADGIYLGAYSEDNIITVKPHEKHSAQYYLTSLRDLISESLNSVLPYNNAALCDAMLTGNTANVKESIRKNFSYSGISHLFAVSGFHLSLWSTAVFTAFSKIFGKRKYLSYLLTVAFVIFFMALTGFSKSVLRAGIMLIIMLSGKLIKYKADSLNSLFISIMLILLVNPFAITSISLQMSFLAALGILVLSEPISSFLDKLKEKFKSELFYKITSAIFVTAVISLAAAIFTMPVCALNFGYISMLSPVSNLLCLLPSQIIMLLSGICSIISKITFLSKPVGAVLTLLTRFVIFVTDNIAVLKYSVTDTSAPFASFLIFSIVIIMCVFMLVFRKNSKKLFKIFMISAFSFYLASAAIIAFQQSSVKITVADVGNGTSVTLKTGDTTAVIGCGGNSALSYRFTELTDLNSSVQLLVLPRNTETEAGYSTELLKQCKINSCILSKSDFINEEIPLLPDNTYYTDNCTVKLDDETLLDYINLPEFSGVHIKSGSFSCTIVFKPLSDFNFADDYWKEGDLLISRQAVPLTDISNFNNIIISSNKKLIYKNENVFTTEYGGTIVLRYYKPLGISTVTEEHNDYK